MGNINVGNNTGIIGDGNIIIFNTQAPLLEEQIESELIKLEIGDFQDISDEVDESLHERNISIFSYTKNYWLQFKKQLVQDDFNDLWLPTVPADMEGRERKPRWKLTPIYQNVVFPFSYCFIEMDGGRYLIPLPHVEYNRIGEELDQNNPIRRCTITKVQYQLGKVLTNGVNYGNAYDDMLKECKIEVID